MAKKANDVKDGSVLANIIIVRSAWGKANQEATIQPMKDANGVYPKCVRKVDANGDMIITEADKEILDQLIPENAVITLYDGKLFNLDNPREKAEWEAIKNCFLIAPDRYAKDANGNYLIDGTNNANSKMNNGAASRYGRAEWYVQVPGLDSQKRMTRAKLVNRAENFIYNDEGGYESLLRIAKVLGRNMTNMHTSEVEEFLISVAQNDPEKIINLYTGGELSYRLLFVTAKEKGIIRKTGGVYFFGSDQALGSTDDGVIEWMKNPKNAKTLDLIKQETMQDLIN